MCGISHVDEVENDDAAKIAQPELPRDRHGGFQIGAEDSFLEIAVPDVAAGVHIDGGHRLGLIDDQVAAGLQRHLAIQGARQLLFHAMQSNNGR